MTATGRPLEPGSAERACAGCLRRGFLLGLLAPRIAGVLDSRNRNPGGLLALEDEPFVKAVAGRDGEQAERFLETFDAGAAGEGLEEHGFVGVCRHSREYPVRLLQLPDPPRVLFMAGRVAELLPVLSRGPAVAVVGTRRPSPYGLEMARSLGRGLARAEVAVVSGLAMGIDAAAHVGCLDGGGAAVAVLGGGPDIAYPRTNRALHGQVGREGLLLSELPPGRRPYRWSFPARNRIMAGLAEATVVVEAAEGSGSLITTDFASDLGRVVAAVPGEATSSRARGSNQLLRSGAAVINRVEDVIEELFGIGGRVGVQESAAKGGPDEGDPLSQAVIQAVEAGMGIDGACVSAGLPVNEVRAILSRLEEAGKVRRDALGAYTRAAP
ncbi:MAG: DNA-protecting protein DprA [Thermoleophilaceae bacterium]|nr:DNA-protecting protein DprA [Thermoleophilaceae bacterium]